MAGSQSISKAFFNNLLDKKKGGDDVNKSLFKLFEKNDPKLEGTLNDVPKWTPPVVATPKEDDSQKQKKATKGKKAEKEESGSSSEVAKKDNTKQQNQKNGKDVKKETKKEEKKETKKEEKKETKKEEKEEKDGEAKEEDSDEEAKAEKLERPPKRQRSKAEYQRTIAINNVPETIKKNFLSKLFGKYGTVESVRLWNATNGGFIVMDTVAGAQKAVSEIHGMELKGQELSAMIHTGPEKNPQKGAKKTPQKGKPSLSSPSPNKKNSSTPTKKFSTPQKSSTPTRTPKNQSAPSTPKTPGTAEKLKNFGTLTKKAISNTLKRKERTPSEASPKADTTDKRPIREVTSASPPAKKRQYVKVVNKNAKKSS